MFAVTWHAPVPGSWWGHASLSASHLLQHLPQPILQRHSRLTATHVPSGEREYDALSTEQRGAVLGALEAVMLDTNFMRLTVAATTDTRREVAQELAALRARLRKCAGLHLLTLSAVKYHCLCDHGLSRETVGQGTTSLSAAWLLSPESKTSTRQQASGCKRSPCAHDGLMCSARGPPSVGDTACHCASVITWARPAPRATSSKQHPRLL